MNNDKQVTESSKSEEKSKASNGGRNLVILGIAATLIAFTTTFIALKIYHDSGDIYLDRSRPGFLPEKDEAEAEKDPGDYSFPDTGKLTKETLDEYIENLEREINRLEDFSTEPFSEAPLSNEALGF